VRVKFTREGGQFAIDRTVSGVDKPNPESSKLSVDAPADATYGNTALALFLRHAPKKASARYAVSWFAPDLAGLKRGDHDPAPSTEARIEVLGGASFEASGQPCPTWAALVEHDGRTRELHFAPDDRAMIGILGRVPPVHVVPKGTAPPATKSDVDAPANSWRAAFLKFGRGYHMAVEEWLDAAFHWPSFYEYETSLPGGWPKEKPVDEFKKAWIEEFLKNSKHRPRSQADQLLQGTLMTGTVKEETADKVVFAAHPEYGGGVQRTYHFAKIDGVWYLTRIDEAQ
jgi:hypothetical protein